MAAGWPGALTHSNTARHRIANVCIASKHAMAVPPALLPALDALFGMPAASSSSSPDARRSAEAWLVAFQAEDGAWQVSEEACAWT